MITCYNIVIAVLLPLNIVLNLEYKGCIKNWERLFFNYKNFNKSLHYKIILSNQIKSLEYNCTQENSEISWLTLTFDTYVGILQQEIVTTYNITILAENKTVLSFPFTFDQCHLLACENVISFTEIQKIQKLDDHELSVTYGMRREGKLPPNISGYIEIETTDHSNRRKQISHVDKNTLIQGSVPNEKKVKIQNSCSDYKVCLVTSWPACVNNKKVNKTFLHCKVKRRTESSTNIDAQCRLYPREKRVQVIFVSSVTIKEFELSISGNTVKHTTNKSSISIPLTTENMKNVSLTPCTKCSCSKKEKVKCIEDKVTRGKNFINVWYIVIAAVIIPVIVVVLLGFFCRGQELIKRIMQRGRGETVEPRERASEYIEIFDKHSYNEVVLCKEVGGDIN